MFLIILSSMMFAERLTVDDEYERVVDKKEIQFIVDQKKDIVCSGDYFGKRIECKFIEPRWSANDELKKKRVTLKIPAVSKNCNKNIYFLIKKYNGDPQVYIGPSTKISCFKSEIRSVLKNMTRQLKYKLKILKKEYKRKMKNYRR